MNFSHISFALVAWDSLSPQPPILGHNLFKCASDMTAGPVVDTPMPNCGPAFSQSLTAEGRVFLTRQILNKHWVMRRCSDKSVQRVAGFTTFCGGPHQHSNKFDRGRSQECKINKVAVFERIIVGETVEWLL